MSLDYKRLKDLSCKTRLITKYLLTAVISLFLVYSPASAQLNENCTVSILNRTANVQPNGVWTLPNTPSNMGQVRARVTCVENGVTKSGQSDFFTVVANTITDVGEILFDGVERGSILYR